MKNISAEKAASPVGPYPHARTAGDFLYLSGIGPRVPGSKQIPGVNLNAQGEIVSYSIIEQTHACFANVSRILEAAGGSLADALDVQVFLTDIKKDFSAFNEVYAEYFSSESGPTRTTVGVVALPTPIAVELKVVLWKQGGFKKCSSPEN